MHFSIWQICWPPFKWVITIHIIYDERNEHQMARMQGLRRVQLSPRWLLGFWALGSESNQEETDTFMMRGYSMEHLVWSFKKCPCQLRVVAHPWNFSTVGGWSQGLKFGPSQYNLVRHCHKIKKTVDIAQREDLRFNP